MLDFLGEIGTLDPWLHRGWAYIFSAKYRADRHKTWSRRGKLYAIADIIVSLVVLTLEILLICVVAQPLITWLRGT